MFVYDRSEGHEALLRDWYQQMVADGDLVQTWGIDATFAEVRDGLESAVVYLDVVNDHPWFVAWVLDGPLSTGFLSCWTAPTHRHSKQTLRNFGLVLHCLFTTYALACCITLQESVALFLTKVGFQYLGTVQPHAVHVLYYPREKFLALREQIGADNGR